MRTVGEAVVLNLDAVVLDAGWMAKGKRVVYGPCNDHQTRAIE